MSAEMIHTLAAALRDNGERPLLVCTGAGVSLASGIPTFRGTDPNAVWARDVTQLGTREFYSSDPAGSWEFYLRRFDSLEGKVPNPAHLALRHLEQWHVRRSAKFLLVTQNIDCLHEQAGSEALVKVHGSSDRVRCSKHGCINAAPRGSLARSTIDFAAFRTSPSAATVPRCPECQSSLRPHVLWFDERYDEHRGYEIVRVIRAAKQSRLVIFVGTSFAVGVTALILEYGVAKGRVFSVDPGGLKPHRRVEVVAEPAERALPEVMALLDP